MDPISLWCDHSIKEACYSRVPARIPLQINDFPMLTLLQICFIACRSSHESNGSLSRPSKCPLWPLESGSYLPGMKFLQYGTGCATGCSEVTNTTVSCLLNQFACFCQPQTNSCISPFACRHVLLFNCLNDVNLYSSQKLTF